MAGCVEGRDWQSAAWLRCWDPTSPDIIGQTNENMEFLPKKKWELNQQIWVEQSKLVVEFRVITWSTLDPAASYALYCS
jgi:hypothetical protein